jgi:hypothetical protein
VGPQDFFWGRILAANENLKASRRGMRVRRFIKTDKDFFGPFRMTVTDDKITALICQKYFLTNSMVKVMIN